MKAWARRALAPVLLSVASIAAALLVAEGALRVAGFEYRTFPSVQFGWPEPTAIANVYVPDRELFWVTRDYAATLEAGRRSRPAVVFIGDSCTQFGTYPRRTLDLLAARSPDLARGIKLGVGGWSSVQGLAQLRRDVLPLKPRVVTVYFGWNDHWMAFGRTDAEISTGPVGFWLSQHSRVAQLVLKARLGVAGSLDVQRPARVGLALYRSNLEAMAAAAREAGVRLVLITAPSGHVAGQEPAYLAARQVRPLSDLIPLHRAYVEATRAAAGASGAALCDAAEAFDRADAAHAGFFKKDGIHLTDAGDAAMARLVAGCIEAAVR
jgi:lysophospholipase L1-like esterase